jgi:hypothetical protein
MSKYTDLLEHRSKLKSIKETMYQQLGYSKENLELLTEQINKLSIEIRSLEPEIDNSWFPDTEYVKKPPITPLDYKTFYEFYKDTVINSINNQLNSINVPIGVYAIFKNTVVKSEDYIMKHHYNIYCSEVEQSNQ